MRSRYALVCVVAVAATGCGGGSTATATRTVIEGSAATTTGTLDTAAEACLEKWNADPGQGAIVAEFAQQHDVYASVGPSETFPDKCMVTVAVPDVDRAYQYLEGASVTKTDHAYGPKASGNVGDLPASTTQWNARLEADGSLTPTVR